MAVAGHALKTYNRRIAKLVELWPECWHIIYQADDLMRSEHMEKIRRKIAREVNEGGTKPAYWDENAPWTTVFIAAAADTTFWDTLRSFIPRPPLLAAGALVVCE